MSNKTMIDLSNALKERKVVSLNGQWEVFGADMNLAVGDLPAEFTNAIPVPGLWDMASEKLEKNAAWYKKIIVISGSLPKSVVLKINKAFWGKYIYINGKHVCDHQPNFTPAYVDIQPYLQIGENTLLVKIGAYGSQDPNLGHVVGFDKEKFHYIPGIYDDVSLIFSQNPVVRYVQVAPQIEKKSALVQVSLENILESDAKTSVTISVYEHLTGHLVGRAELFDVAIESKATAQVSQEIKISDVKLWSPEDPFLYDVEVITDGDSYRERFGMREFYFDQKTKLPVLNGKTYYLRGNNITMYRFFEDPMRGNLPWDREWARKVLQSFKALNMNSIRYCIGFPPELWYELADEMGFLIDDEYPIWLEVIKMPDGKYPYWSDVLPPDVLPPIEETIIPELIDWINERANHACVTQWDIQNETVTFLTEVMIRKIRELRVDLSNRPWDNGWGPAASPEDSIEVHPYLFIAQYTDKSFKWKDLNQVDPDPAVRCPRFYNYNRLEDPAFLPDNPRIINEYGWLWINRDASPTTLTKKVYDVLLPNASPEQRREYYAKGIAKLTEFWRSGRKSAGVLYFCGLTYCNLELGCTCDAYLPDITNPTYDPLFEKMMADAMAPVGICIQDWSEEHSAGVKNFAVAIYNDLPESWKGPVELMLRSGEKTWSNESKIFEVEAFGRIESTFAVDIPDEEKKNLTLIASYTDDTGEKICSVREFKII